MDIKNQEQIAIDTCISAVQVYLPCEESTPLNHTCLCEQYAWHVACYDNHASSRASRINADTAMRDSCLAAGIMDVATIQRRHNRERRQLGSFLNSIGGVAASFLSRESIALPIPTAISSLPATTSARTTSPARTTSQASSATRSAQSSAPAPTTLASSVSPTTSQAPFSKYTPTQSAAASNSGNSKSSIGLIAGAVVGGIAVVILLAIIIAFCLRHKRKKRQAPVSHTHSPMLDNASHRSLDETLMERTPMVEPRTTHSQQVVPIGGHVQNEKAMYASRHKPLPVPTQIEMETSANVWELDATEKPRTKPTTIESPDTTHAHVWSERPEQRRSDRDELHF